MTINEMKVWLGKNYEEQALKFPRLRVVTKARYISVNLEYMRRSRYWREREVRYEGNL